MTTRLRGLPLSETDFDDLYDLNRDERVLAAFEPSQGRPPEEAREAQEFLDLKLAHWVSTCSASGMFRDHDGSLRIARLVHSG
jgi:hypothetical protein